jgi:hypothetical protein
MKTTLRSKASTVAWPKPVAYPIYYVPRFPLEILRYRDLASLDPLGLEWRKALLEDISARGLKCPMLVLNHQQMKNSGGSHLFPDLAMVINKPFHLRVGRNRRWALRELGWTHAPAVVTGPIRPDMDGELVTTAERLQQVWTDGDLRVEKDMVYCVGKCDPTERIYPE